MADHAAKMFRAVIDLPGEPVRAKARAMHLCDLAMA
jgi:hypothetical protein